MRLLRHRLAALNTGKPGGPSEEELLSFEDLAADYIQEREVRGAKGVCLQWSKSRVANLKSFFGGMRAVEITTHRMREYARKRLALGAAPGTVNRDFGVLSRMFTLAIQAGTMANKAHRTVFLDGKDAPAVVLLFVDPPLRVERAGYLGGVHEGGRIGHWPETLSGHARRVNVSLKVDMLV